MNNLRNIVEGHWEEIKGKVQSNWSKLTESDLDEINGSYKELTGKIQQLYGYKAAEVKSEIEDFLDSNQFKEIKNNAISKFDEIKTAITSTLDEYFQSSKKKTIDIEKTIVDYTLNNPLKVMGIIAIAGLTIGSLYKKQ